MKNSTTIDSASWYLSLIKMIYLLFFPPFLKLLLQILTTKLQQIDKISKQYKATMSKNCLFLNEEKACRQGKKLEHNHPGTCHGPFSP